MKKLNHSLGILCLTLLLPFDSLGHNQSAQDRLPETFKILPAPRQIELLPGRGIFHYELGKVVLQNVPDRPVMGEILDLLPNGIKNETGVLTLQRENTADLPSSDEGYILTVKDGQVLIRSRGEAGLFYGCQTLEQLLEDSREYDLPVPSCIITDFPEISYRAVQIDVKHHLDHMQTYYKTIDRLSRYKINAVIFEFEDKLRYQRQPLIGSPQSISIDEMAALTIYAGKRHIEISPLVQGLGHASYILKHEQYSYLREQKNNRWAFCPLHEGTYQVLFDLYRDAMEATPGSRYLHIGGDEVGNIGICPRCKPTADENGILSLNVYWLNRVCEFIINHGRIPIFWDDMPLQEAGVYESTSNSSISREELDATWERGEEVLSSVIKKFPDPCVFMRWNYSTGKQPGNIRALEYYQKYHLNVMIATAAQSGPASLFPFDERDGSVEAMGIPAIKSFIEIAGDKGIGGMLCTAWDDRSLHMETFWRGYIASAQFSWNPGSMSLDKYDEAYLKREYGIEMKNYDELYQSLRKSADFWEGAFNRVSDRMDIQNALLPLPGIAHFLTPEESERISTADTDFSEKLIDLPDPEKPGAWSEKYADRLGIAEEIIGFYSQVSEQLNELYLNSIRNRHHWKVFIALNDFQVTAPRLLLALQDYDKKGPAGRGKNLLQVEQALKSFETAWENLKKVYSETRFISYPSGYIPDKYFHFASQRTDLTWMIQVEELFHRMTREWIIDQIAADNQ